MEQLYYKNNVIKACDDELVIEAIYLTKTNMQSLTFEVYSREYTLQTFFGNDISIEVLEKDMTIVAFGLCDVRDVDWEEEEQHIIDRFDKCNRDIARMYAEQCIVEVVTDNNWRRT